MSKNLGLVESSTDYPHIVFTSEGFRVIRCKDEIQFIAQEWKGGRWRNLSYHMFWRSLHSRHQSRGVPRIVPESYYNRGETGISAFRDLTHLNQFDTALTTENANA